MNTNEPHIAPADCYVALELSRSKWLVGALPPGQDKIWTSTIRGGDTEALLAVFGDIAAKSDCHGYPDIRLRVCFEAG